ncbi:hypothetical protein O181_057295 [Austropuccinia psidii MF-1]|uniref:Uncharacterized protein n=1 Tax=Austropuccinia psidii MF-1 TaxID=1389203 RepID=A0A9Q3EED4_9BASI|nr:hypothetical protein [Austropuccinia psidii MF-1]
MHLFPPEIQWNQYKIVISTFYQVIQESHHPEDSSRPKDKCQSQIQMTPSSNNLLFSFTVFPKGNAGSSFSRDIKEEVPKQFSKGECSINPPWKPHSFNTVWIHQDLYFQSYTMGTSFKSVHFLIWKGINFIKDLIQTSCQPEGVKLSTFHI